MFPTTITFDKLPDAVVYLIGQITRLHDELRELRSSLSPPATTEPPFITAQEAAEILGENKNTIYEKARAGIIPAYKNPGSKSWRFVRSELLDYLASGKRKSPGETYDEMVAEMNKGLRPGGRNKLSR